MFRTRDFVLFFTIIVFLVMAIGVTLLKQGGTEARQNAIIPQTSDEITEVAVLISDDVDVPLDRESRLSDLRDKIAGSELVSISEPEPEPDPELTVTDPEPGVTPGTLQLCSSYAPAIITWPVADIEVSAAEGVRQYFTTNEVVTGTSSASTTLERTVLLTLPTQFVPLGDPQCINSDVIGIAIDGSLIRNNETGLYSIFTSETLIGYALDGFPIYGVGQATADGCGGRIALGQYRYELSADRETVLNCFAGLPQSFQ